MVGGRAPAPEHMRVAPVRRRPSEYQLGNLLGALLSGDPKGVLCFPCQGAVAFILFALRRASCYCCCAAEVPAAAVFATKWISIYEAPGQRNPLLGINLSNLIPLCYRGCKAVT